MPSYVIAGLVVASDVPLPGAPPASTARGPDVSMRLGAVPQALDGEVFSHGLWRTDGARFLIDVREVGRFLVTGGDSVIFQPRDGVAPAECAIFLQGSVFGVLLHQRGLVVLHASAVAVDGVAVLFCGPSGAGKSTFAAILSRRGYPLLGDDICVIDFDAGGAPVVRADSRQHKLTSESIAALGLEARRGAAVRRDVLKYYVRPDVGAPSGEMPLGAAYMLQREGPQSRPVILEPGLERKLRLLQRNAYRPGVVKHTGQVGRYFAAAAAVAAKTPVFLLTPPRDLARLGEAADGMERHWREIGLLPGIAAGYPQEKEKDESAGG
jgi:hypothetical protein